MKALLAFFSLAALAATAPLWPAAETSASHHEPASAASARSAADWPPELVAPEWTPLPLGAREQRFARDFPGRIAAFAASGGRTIILRRIDQPTRKLHPAADCLRAVGYDIAPRPIHRQIDGIEWGEFRATRGNDTLRVRERLLGADDRRWTDVSAWYWSAALGRAAGPWWAVTELAPD